ncbi:MAG: hypothetical protein VCA74_10135 [Deltaproteobacteria bacterium]
MKRILQMVSLLLAVLAVVLVWRVMEVMKIQPPEFSNPVQTTDVKPLPPAPARLSATSSMIKSVIDGNLFEAERGQRPQEEETEEELAPLPPPTNISLNGILLVGEAPVAIMTDSKSGGRQLRVRVGEMVGDYEVGGIDARQVTLMGAGGQRFNVVLQTRKGASRMSRPRTPVRSAPRPSASRPVPARGARPTPPSPSARMVVGSQKPIPRSNPPTAVGKPVKRAPTPAQARLEALKRLREAAKKK